MNSSNAPYRKVALIIVILTQACTYLLGSELPQSVRLLVEKRQIAISKVNMAFVQELEKLKVNYTKASDLENANLIADLIRRTKESDSNGYSQDGGGALTLLDSRLVGKWMIYDTESPKVWAGVITITKDLAYSCQGTFGIYNNRQSAGKVEIKKNNIILVGPYEFNISTISSGKIFSKNLGVRTMERVK